VVRKGKEGAEEIQAMMKAYRENPPKSIGGSQLLILHDYQTQKSMNYLTGVETAINLPVSNVLQFILEDKTKISVRPSGTEPKIKFYFSVTGKLSSREDYKKTEESLKDKIKQIQLEMNLI